MRHAHLGHQHYLLTRFTRASTLAISRPGDVSPARLERIRPTVVLLSAREHRGLWKMCQFQSVTDARPGCLAPQLGRVVLQAAMRVQ